jgi:hypothetical protein
MIRVHVYCFHSLTCSPEDSGVVSIETDNLIIWPFVSFTELQVCLLPDTAERAMKLNQAQHQYVALAQ